MNVDCIPTGSMTLDAALGIGGLPRGRIVEIYGPEAVSYTHLSRQPHDFLDPFRRARHAQPSAGELHEPVPSHDEPDARAVHEGHPLSLIHI